MVQQHHTFCDYLVNQVHPEVVHVVKAGEKSTFTTCVQEENEESTRPGWLRTPQTEIAGRDLGLRHRGIGSRRT